MARPVWTGSIGFGLVNVPVKAYTAVRDHDLRVDGCEVHEVEGDVLSLAHLEAEELAELRPESTRAEMCAICRRWPSLRCG